MILLLQKSFHRLTFLDIIYIHLINKLNPDFFDPM